MFFVILVFIDITLRYVATGSPNHCHIVHALFDLNIVSDSKPGHKNLYHFDVINKLMSMNVFTEKELREIKVNNTKQFLDVAPLKGKEPNDQEINQCYLDEAKKADNRCKYVRVYQISKLFFHDVVNLYRYYKQGHEIRNGFDMYAHWVELADFYILHPDITDLCPQPKTTCGHPQYQPKEKKNYRLVFRPICYSRMNKDKVRIPLKMDPPNIYAELARNETHTDVVQDRWYRLMVTYDETNGLREEVKRLCLLRVESDFCFIEPMVRIYRRYLSYRKDKEYRSDMCRRLLMFNFEDFVLAKTRPTLIDFWMNEFKSGDDVNTNSSEFEFIHDSFPPLFEFIRKSKKEDIAKVISCLEYPLRFMNSCSTHENIDEKRCMFAQVIDKIHGYIDVNKTNLKIIDTTIDLKKYIGSFRLDSLLNNIETKTQKLKHAKYREKIFLQKPLHDHFKGLKKFFSVIANFNQKKMLREVSYIENRMDDYIVASEEDSKLAAKVLDDLFHIVLVTTNYDTSNKTNIRWGITILEALNPMAKLSRNSPTDIFVSLQELIKRIRDTDFDKELKGQILNVTNLVYRTKLGFFKNSDLIRFVKTTVHHSNDTNLDFDFARSKALFLKNYDEYSPWISKEKLTEITSALQEIRETACNLITEAMHLGIPDNAVSVFEELEKGRDICAIADAEIQRMIETLKETNEFQYELLETFASYMRAKETHFAATSLMQQVDSPISSDWMQTFYLSLYSRLIIYFEQLIAIDSFCDLREYKEFGVRPDECSQFPSSIGVSDLIHTDKSYCKGKASFVRIPIIPGPKKVKDNGFMILSELLYGNETSFQVPDVDWLIRHEWISEKTDYPIYISHFEIFLPVVSDKKTQVTIQGRLAGNNVLDPEDEKQYIIRPTPELDTKYTEGKDAFKNCKNLIENPYRTCPKPGWDLPKVCLLTSDSSDPSKAYGSVYATWKFIVMGYEDINIPVAAFTNDTFLKASVRLCTKLDGAVITKTKDRNVSKRTETLIIKKNKMTLENRKRSIKNYKTCCLEGHYYSQTKEKCISCPDGYERAMKGYYCRKDVF